MQPPSINQLFKEWQRELRLLDWDIRFGIRSAMEMGSDHGRVRIHELKKCAFISLLDPDEPADPTEIDPYDMEVTLVHELLHVVHFAFCVPADDSAEHLCIENAVHSQSKLLVSMKRRIRQLETQRKRKAA